MQYRNLLFLMSAMSIAALIFSFPARKKRGSSSDVSASGVFFRTAALAGGAAGAAAGFILSGFRLKRNGVNRGVYTLLLLAVQLGALFLIRSGRALPSLFSFGRYSVPAAVFIVLMNCTVFFLYAADKFRSVNHSWRIKESLLLTGTVLFGAAGAFAAMYIFNHKLHTAYFFYPVPLMLAAQTAILVFLPHFIF